MAAPTPSNVRLADDASNLGKRVRTQDRLVGATQVHEHFFIPISQRSKRVFHYSPTALQALTAAAQDGTTTAYWWLQNPVGNAWDLIIRKLVAQFGTTNVLTSTIPRLVCQRFTFASTASGASVTPARRKTAEAPNAFLRTAPTGMTALTLTEIIASHIVPQMHAAGQVFAPPPFVWPEDHDPFEDDDVILTPGEGAVLYQADAGTTSDPRRFVYTLRAEEVER